MSLDRLERPSRITQPSSRMKIRYNSRRATKPDPAGQESGAPGQRQTPGHPHSRVLGTHRVSYLTDPTADGAAYHEFDLHYVEGIDALHDAEFGLVVDEKPTTLRFSRGHLDQTAGAPADPILTVHTSSAFMGRWAAGTVSWDDGRTSGEVAVEGPDRNWDIWLAATGYLLAYDPEPDHA